MPASTRDSKLLDGQPLRPARSNMVGGRLCQTGGGQLGLSQTGVKQALMPSGTGGKVPFVPVSNDMRATKFQDFSETSEN